LKISNIFQDIDLALQNPPPKHTLRLWKGGEGFRIKEGANGKNG